MNEKGIRKWPVLPALWLPCSAKKAWLPAAHLSSPPKELLGLGTVRG